MATAIRQKAKRLVQTVAVAQMAFGAFLVNSIDVGVGLIVAGVMLLLVSEWRRPLGGSSKRRARKPRAAAGQPASAS